MQVSGHYPVVAACCLRPLIIIRALRHAELLRDKYVVETVFGWFRLTAADDTYSHVIPSMTDHTAHAMQSALSSMDDALT